MGYIVNLTVILDGIFRTAAGTDLMENTVLNVTFAHITSGRRDSIHRDIRSFVTGAFATRFAVPRQDLFLENIIGLIRKYCAPLEYN